MAKGGGFFGFIDILQGIAGSSQDHHVPGVVAVTAGFFSGAFSLVHNPKISGGVGLMCFSLGWRDWEHVRWSNPNPPYEYHWDFGKLIEGSFYYALSAGMFYLAYHAADILPQSL